MPEKILYEYAVVRFVPSVEREEFINVGLVMMCKRRRWIRVAININEAKINALAPDTDLDLLKQQLASFEAISSGKSESPIAALDAHERFRWLTAVRSASITTSRPHPGFCSNLDDTFEELLAVLV